MKLQSIASILFATLLQVNAYRNVISVSVVLKTSGANFRGVASHGITPDGKLFFKIEDSGIADPSGKKHCEKINNYFVELISSTNSQSSQSLGVVKIEVFAGMEICAGVWIWRSVTLSAETPQFTSPIIGSDYIYIFYKATTEAPSYVHKSDPTGIIASKLGSPKPREYVLDMTFCGGTVTGQLFGTFLHYESQPYSISTRQNFAIMTVELNSSDDAEVLKNELLTPGAAIFVTKKGDETDDSSWGRVTVVEAYVTGKDGAAPVVAFGFYIWPDHAKVTIHIECNRGKDKQKKSVIHDIKVTINERKTFIRFYAENYASSYTTSGSSPPDFENFVYPKLDWSITKLVLTYEKKTGMKPRELVYKTGDTTRSGDGNCKWVQIYYHM